MSRALVILWLLVCPADAAPPPDATQRVELERVRSTNARINQALREGQLKAPSFRALVAELQRSDVILHIEAGECSCGTARSCVSFVGRAGTVRYLRATVSLRQIQKELIAHIGHELFHSVEIGAAAQIVSRRTLLQFYEQRGRRTCGLPCGYETEGAVRMQSRLRAELDAQTGSVPPR